MMFGVYVGVSGGSGGSLLSALERSKVELMDIDFGVSFLSYFCVTKYTFSNEDETQGCDQGCISINTDTPLVVIPRQTIRIQCPHFFSQFELLK
jgi:hypothetical protein